MGEKTGHRLEPILRHPRFFGELLESFRLQIAELLLNAVESRHEHRRIQSQPFYSHLSSPNMPRRVGAVPAEIRGSLGMLDGHVTTDLVPLSRENSPDRRQTSRD